MEVTVPAGAAKSLARPIAAVAWLALALGALAAGAALNASAAVRPGPNDYDIVAWEWRNFANKWLFALGEAFRRGRTQAQQDADLRQFLTAVAEVNGLESRGASIGWAGLDRAITERDALENRAEATIEGRITAIAEREGLTRGFGPLGSVVWPPVDLEFTTPPRTLVTSPRDRIELQSTTLLREGLDVDDLERIERKREADYGVSALAFTASGVGAYPTIVTYTSSYRTAVEVAAHEWTHNYLVFRPLGARYYESNQLRTMNETVADIVGSEIADAVVREWPLTEPAAPAASRSPGRPATATVDLRAELVKLRGEVDTLLGAGQIEEAERLMEDRRQYLAANGHYIRRINQAYFAFTNLYAGARGSPGAVNPIGPKLDELRRLSGSLAAFLRIAGDLTSVAALDRALAEMRP